MADIDARGPGPRPTGRTASPEAIARMPQETGAQQWGGGAAPHRHERRPSTPPGDKDVQGPQRPPTSCTSSSAGTGIVRREDEERRFGPGGTSPVPCRPGCATASKAIPTT